MLRVLTRSIIYGIYRLINIVLYKFINLTTSVRMTKSIHLIIKNSILGVVVVTALVANIASAATTASLVPSCSVSVTPASITSAQSATLKWDATEGAIFTSIDNGIGAVGVDGTLTVSPNTSTVYTVHTWNSQGEGSTCTTTLIVDGLPVVASINGLPSVTLQTLAIHPAATRVVLSNVPYTGAAESALYTFFLLSLVLTAGYAFKNRNKLVRA